LVAAIRKQGFTVEPIPGASAVVAAISASGITSQGFAFLGFPPNRGKDRKRWFESVVAGAKDRLVVFFEAPHKLQKTLGELGELVNRPIIVARELTKIHEEFVSGTPAEIAARFPEPHGEFTIMIPPQDPAENAAIEVTDEEVLELFGRITETGQSSSKRDAARTAGEQLGLTAKQVYDILERNK
jgi:16S rRNA (cytidine1402-2'-O)-methyltransferase